MDRVEPVETHISVVLLAGDYAYKIKKPVDFGFVDFSSLDRRRFFCEEELRLNRRFSPEIYLDIVAIHGSSEAPSFGSAGEIIEYAVRMRRFDQDALLDRCIRNGDAVTGAMIEDFADHLAAIHGAADMADPAGEHGSPETIRRNLVECIETIRGVYPDPGRYRSVLSTADQQVDSLAQRFKERLDDGCVRECHGDLHLGNLFMTGREIHAFDCIEFNPGLRWIDVANEIAFTTMDLRYHDRDDLARRFRNAYLDATGDHLMMDVLGFYELYRALVRAKVAALRETEQAGAGEDAIRTHLELAARMVESAPSPELVITCGLSGSGKTFRTGKLVAGSEFIRIRSDVERGHLARSRDDRYTTAGRQEIYEHLLNKTERLLAMGQPVIVDATFLKKTNRDRFRALAGRFDVPFHILYCEAPEAELRQRIESRSRAGDDESEADTSVLDLQRREFDPLSDEEKQHLFSTFDLDQ